LACAGLAAADNDSPAPDLRDVQSPTAEQAAAPAHPPAYIRDRAHYRSARLETEAMLFDRLEKEAKIDSIRSSVKDARTRLQEARRTLRAPGGNALAEALRQLKEPEPQEGIVASATSALQDAQNYLDAAVQLLKQFKDRSSRDAADIAAGRAESLPLFSAARRLVKAAEFRLERQGREIVQPIMRGGMEGQKGLGTLDYLRGAERELELARGDIAALRDKLADTDQRKERLGTVLRSLEQLDATLDEAIQQDEQLTQKLDKLRRLYFPECVLDGTGCEPLTRDLLRKAVEGMDGLSAVSHDTAVLRSLVEKLHGQWREALQAFEQAAPALPAAREAMRHQADLERALEDVLDLLRQANEALVAPCPKTETRCPDCNKPIRETAKVSDPTVTCALAGKRLEQVDATLSQARAAFDAIEQQLRQAEEEAKTAGAAEDVNRFVEALRNLRGRPEGVGQHIAVASGRVKEYREQQFESFPIEGTSPELLPRPPMREWDSMSAHYAGRVTWRYPTYFEDLNAERYGNHLGLLQPAVSWGRFYVDLALVPYKMCLEPPWEPQYTLGLYRPGDPAPHLIYLPRPSLGGVLLQGGATVGLFAFP
jgi:hypothetical protein